MSHLTVFYDYCPAFSKQFSELPIKCLNALFSHRQTYKKLGEENFN